MQTLKEKLIELGFEYTETEFGKSQIWKQKGGDIRVHYNILSDNITSAYTWSRKGDRLMNIHIYQVTAETLEERLIKHPQYQGRF